MRKITILFLLLSSLGYGQSLNGVQTIGQPTRNQGVGNGLQVEDTTLLKGKVWLSNITTVGGATDSVLSINPTTKLVELRPQSTGGGGAVSDSAWSLTGNLATDPSVNFLGTKDTASLAIRVNDSIRMLMIQGQIELAGVGYDTTLWDSSTSATTPVLTNNFIINRIGSSRIPVSSVMNTVPNSNTVFGNYAGYSIRNNSAHSLTLIGTGAGMSLAGFADPTTFSIGAYENTVIGAYCAMFSDSIDGCFVGGTHTMQFSRNLKNTVAIGLAAARFMYTGLSNVFIGPHCAENVQRYADAAAVQCTFVGGDAGNNYKSGGNNTLIGHDAGLSFEFGNANTVVGESAFQNATAGGNNTVLGFFAGGGLINTNQSIHIGDLTGQFTNRALSLLIGTGAFCASATDDSLLTIIAGQMGADSSAQRLRINGKLRVAGLGEFSGNVSPTVTGVYDLGRINLCWDTAYIKVVTACSNVTINTDTLKMTGAAEVAGDLIVNGKITATGGVDPPYVSFKEKSHGQIVQYSKKVKDDVMQFFCAQHNRMELYKIRSKKFITLAGTPVN